MTIHTALVISQTDARPMYQQIVEQIRQRVAAGDWRHGDELPSIRALAAAISVSVITVKRAYLELERDGVIVTRQGRGSFVAETADLDSRLYKEELDGHLEDAIHLADLLGIDDQALIARLTGLRNGNEGPTK